MKKHIFTFRRPDDGGVSPSGETHPDQLGKYYHHIPTRRLNLFHVFVINFSFSDTVDMGGRLAINTSISGEICSQRYVCVCVCVNTFYHDSFFRSKFVTMVESV
jgi:hypothetical protein